MSQFFGALPRSGKELSYIMPEKKRQHYVPKLYMRNFVNQNQMFMVYLLEQKKILGPVPYQSQCYKDYYYGSNGVWENQLSEMEKNWGTTFRAVIDEQVLSTSDIQLLKRFAMYQRQRTLAEGEYRKKERTELLVEYGKLLYENNGWQFDSTAENICKERAIETVAPAEGLEIAKKLIGIIDDLRVLIITYDTEEELISSDVPVIAINPYHYPSIGFGCMGLILLFPISPHKLIVIYDSKMYPRFRDRLYVSSRDSAEVHKLNVLQLISAEKIIYAHSGSAFNLFSEDDWQSRIDNIKEHTISTLGQGNNKIFVTGMRTTILQYGFSFGEVCHRFKRIPFVCREAAPRQWDIEWEKKFDTKVQIFPAIARTSPRSFAQYNLSPKELRKGCERMATAAKVYWTQSSC